MYTVRTILDGELTRTLMHFGTIEEAYACYDRLTHVLVPGESAMIYDEDGNVEAEVCAV